MRRLTLGAALALSLVAGLPVAHAAPRSAPPPAAPAAPPPRATAAAPWPDLDAQLDARQWQPVAEAADAILADGSKSAWHGGAWLRLGRALAAGGYDYAALLSLGEAARLDPAGAAPFYALALDLAEKLDEDAWLGERIGADLGVPMDGPTRGRVALFAARAQFAKGSWVGASSLLPLVPADSPSAIDADVLRGVALAQQGKYEAALDPLMAAYDAAIRADRDPHYVATVALNVARTWFAAGNFAQSMTWYDRVPRSDTAWLEAHFERAWAHFRVDDMQGTLALLTTHGSPFFTDVWQPEADLLRAQAFYLMCYFREAKNEIDAFQGHYQPLVEQIRGSLGTVDAAGAVADARAAIEGTTTRLPASLMVRWTSDDRLAESLAAIDVAAAEVKRLSGDGWSARARALVQARQDARTTAEGTRILDAVADARDQVAEMLTDIELTRIDLLTYESQLLQQAAATGQAQILVEREARLREQRRKGKQVWPFQGEYWADELGWFRIDALSACPSSLQRGQ